MAAAKGSTLTFAGKEPKTFKFKTNKERRRLIFNTYNWYNVSNTYKDSAIMLQNWLLENDRKDEYKLVKALPAFAIPNAVGWLVRMNSNGFELQKEELDQINETISYALEKHKKVINKVEVPAESTTVTIQDRMREKADDCAIEIEHIFDEYIQSNAPAKHSFSPINILKVANILPQHVNNIIEHWNETKIEISAAYTGSDPDLIEGYDVYTKIQLRNMIKFIDLIIADLNSYIVFKKVTKTPRKRKPVSPEKQVRKLKYLQACEELNIKSIPPTKILNAKELFVYSTKKRKLHYYIADDSIGSVLLVKNNTIVGFDPTKSGMKTIRKPSEQISALMKASRPNTRKLFHDIKAVECRLTGRFAEDLLILKAF